METTAYLIIGAGPAGLFMASELTRLGEQRFIVIDRGPDLPEREYAVRHLPHSSAREAIVYGIGGAGLFSDGKFNFSPRIGGAAYSVLSPALYSRLTDYAIRRFNFEVVPPNVAAKRALEADFFLGKDWEIVTAPQVHIGSDHLPTFVRHLMRTFRHRIRPNETVVSVKRLHDTFVVRTDRQSYAAARLVIAVGQAGYALAETVARTFGLSIERSPADLGIRVEMPHQLWQSIVDVQWDTKIYWHTPAGAVRTFCTNPRGFVVAEYKKGFLSVNGHSKRDTQSAYTNLALMLKIEDERPNEFLVDLCTRIGDLTQRRALVQPVDDFLNSRPPESIGHIEPTCSDYALGDITPVYPARACTAYRDVLEAIADSIPKFQSSGAVLYAPEVKLYSNRIKVEPDSFESELPGLFVVGDSCGYIHGLANAMLSGIACGRHCASGSLSKSS